MSFYSLHAGLHAFHVQYKQTDTNHDNSGTGPPTTCNGALRVAYYNIVTIGVNGKEASRFVCWCYLVL